MSTQRTSYAMKHAATCVQLRPAQAARSTAGAAAAVRAAVHEVVGGVDASQKEEALALEGEASDAVASALFEAVVMTPLDEDRDAAAEEAAEAAASLHALEVQVWLELDELLRGIARLAGDPMRCCTRPAAWPHPAAAAAAGPTILHCVRRDAASEMAVRAAQRAKMPRLVVRPGRAGLPSI